MNDKRNLFFNNTPSVFKGRFAQELTQWDTITVSGILSEYPKHVFFSFLDHYKAEFVFLRFSICIDEKFTIRTCGKPSNWDQEEHRENIGFPIDWQELSGNRELIITFGIGEKKMFIAINGVFYCHFSYCQPISSVRTIEIRGDLAMMRQFDHRTIFPIPWPKLHNVNARDVFSCDIPIPFRPGSIIVITAVPSGNQRGHFVIYFTEGISKKEVFHFNARFKPHFIVVRNAMNPQFKLANEERYGGFPFKHGVKFRMAIALTGKQFRVAVNGIEFTTFSFIQENLPSELSGLKIKTRFGMEVRVSGAEHYQLRDGDCRGYEIYSKLDED